MQSVEKWGIVQSISRHYWYLTYRCLVTPLGFLTVFVFKEFLYRSSLSVMWGGRRFLLALTIQAAIGQSRSKPPEVAGAASSFLASSWSLGKRIADFQYSKLLLFSHSGSDRYTSSSDLKVFECSLRKLEVDLRLRSFPLTPLQFLSSELPPDASISVLAWLSFSLSSVFRGEEADAPVSPNAVSMMVRAWSFDGAFREPTSSSNMESQNGWGEKKGASEGLQFWF